MKKQFIILSIVLLTYNIAAMDNLSIKCQGLIYTNYDDDYISDSFYFEPLEEFFFHYIIVGNGIMTSYYADPGEEPEFVHNYLIEKYDENFATLNGIPYYFDRNPVYKAVNEDGIITYYTYFYDARDELFIKTYTDSGYGNVRTVLFIVTEIVEREVLSDTSSIIRPLRNY